MLRPNPERREWKFERNFHSAEYVEWTRRQPCLLCGRAGHTVRTAHVLAARGMGGCGGDYRATGPVCFECDQQWAGGVETFLRRIGVTRDELERRVRAHHVGFERERGHSDQW
jgi:hypothetical protein